MLLCDRTNQLWTLLKLKLISFIVSCPYLRNNCRTKPMLMQREWKLGNHVLPGTQLTQTKYRPIWEQQLLWGFFQHKPRTCTGIKINYSTLQVLWISLAVDLKIYKGTCVLQIRQPIQYEGILVMTNWPTYNQYRRC